MSRQQKPQPVPLDAIGEELLNTLLANLIDDTENRISTLTQNLTRLDLPEQYAFYQHAFSVIDSLHPLPPTLYDVAIAMKMRGIEDVEIRLQNVMTFRTVRDDTNASVVTRLSAFHLAEWYRRLSTERRLERALEVVRNPSGMTPAQERAEISKQLALIAPMAVQKVRLDIHERHEYWMERHGKALDRAKEGQGAYPTFLFEGLNQAIPGLRPADPVMFGAQTKFGKTVLGDVLAEDWAFNQGYYVDIIALETTFESYDLRFMARHLGIPTRFFYADQDVILGPQDTRRIPKLDHRDPRLVSVIGPDMTYQIEEQLNHAGGKVFHTRLKGGATAQHVVEEMAEFITTVSEPAGRQAIFVIDYLQKIRYDKNLEERVGFSINSGIIKDAFDALDCFGIILSQEHIENPENGVERAKSRKSASFGSTVPMMLTQGYVSLQRPPAEKDEAIYVDRDKHPIHNAMGEQRFWALEGQPTGAFAQLVVVAVNDGRQGGQVKIWFESELFQAYCPIRATSKDMPAYHIKRYPYLVDEILQKLPTL